MRGLRFMYLLALAVWLGGLIVLGAVTASTVFEVLQARSPVDGRVLAGAVFGTVLGRFNLMAVGCGLVMAASLVGMALLGPRPRPYAPRLAIIAVMLAAAVAVRGPMGRRIAELQDAAGGPMTALPASDTRRAEFETLHRAANALLILDLAGALVLLLFETRDRE